jgi:nickel-dependent lactate racemase
MAEYSVPWGDQTLEFSLPQHWAVQQIASASVPAASEDWPQRLSMAVSQPCAGPSLGELLARHREGRIVFVLEDNTRHSPLREILEVILREIHHARVPDENLRIVFAAGMHVQMSAGEVREKIGPLAGRLDWRGNPWDDPAEYVTVGRLENLPVQIERSVAEADLRILISSVSPHVQAGFGGGYKMLFPGCASLETIRGLHRYGVGRHFRQLVGQAGSANPMRDAIDRAGRMVEAFGGESFAVQYVLDADDLPAYFAAGEVLQAHRMIVKQCAVSCGVVVQQPADVVLANAHPRDLDLWQCFKCIPNTLWAARPGGAILALARCPLGRHGMPLPSVGVPAGWVRGLLKLVGANGLHSMLTRLLPNVAGDAAFFVRMALQVLARNHLVMVAPTLVSAGVKIPGVHLVESVEAGVTRIDSLLGEGPHNVTIFPEGGTTYPVPPAALGR